MKSIDKITEYHLEIKKSKFICTLIPCNDENQISTLIDQIKQKYSDATHNCVAYIVNQAIKANDDGEPSGTAGLPMLNVLEKQGLENIIAIVTRYFGGIKLGAGGLTRAYSQSVVEALKQANIVEKKLVSLYEITIDYSFSKKMEHLLKTNQIPCIHKEYQDQVTYTCFIENEDFFTFIQDYTNNQYEKKWIKDDYIEIKA